MMTSLQILKLPQMFLSHCIPMDLTALSIESFLRDLKPHFVFHDFTHWLPPLAPLAPRLWGIC